MVVPVLAKDLQRKHITAFSTFSNTPIHNILQCILTSKRFVIFGESFATTSNSDHEEHSVAIYGWQQQMGGW